VRQRAALAGLGLLVGGGLIVGCGGGSSTTSVQIRAFGGFGNKEYSTTIVANGFPPGAANFTLPWTSPTAQLKAGTFVSFAIATTMFDTNVVTCELTSDGRVVSTASAAQGQTATCSGKV
jgi:hypothetical protein